MRFPFTCLLLALLALPAWAQGQPAPVPQGKLTVALDPGMHHSGMRAVFFRDEGRQVVTVGGDLTVRLWDAEGDGPASRVIHLPGARIPEGKTAALTRDGSRLAVSVAYLQDGKQVPVVYVLSLPDGKLTHALRGHTGAGVHALAFTHDGKRLATANFNAIDHSIRVWDLTKADAAPQVIRKVTSDIAISADDKLAWVNIAKEGGIIDLAKDAKEVPLSGGGPKVAWSGTFSHVRVNGWGGWTKKG